MFTKSVNFIHDILEKAAKIKISRKFVAFVTLAVFCLRLLPIMANAFYAHPQADDFSMSVNTFSGLGKYGLSGMIINSAIEAKNMYFTWQGTFRYIFSAALFVGLVGDKYYFLSTFILLFSLILSTLLLTYEIAVRYLKSDIYLFITAACFFISLGIQRVPSVVQGFYWWNGASYYTLFYSFEMLQFALFLSYMRKQNKAKYCRLLLLAFAIGGGNYITALNDVILLTFLNLYLVLDRKDKRFIPVLLCAAAGLIISAAAPGNAVRAAYYANTAMSPLKAVIMSFYHCAVEMLRWTDTFSLTFIFITVLLLYPTYEKRKISFKYPVIFTAFSYCVLSAMFTPSLYAMGVPYDAGRVSNIIWYMYVWIMTADIYYIIGRIRIRAQNFAGRREDGRDPIVETVKNYQIYFCIIMFFAASVFTYQYRHFLTSDIVLKDITSGRSRTYDARCKERVRILEDENIKEAVLPLHAERPVSLYFADADFACEAIANIYGKDSVKFE